MKRTNRAERHRQHNLTRTLEAEAAAAQQYRDVAAFVRKYRYATAIAHDGGFTLTGLSPQATSAAPYSLAQQWITR